jgi:hypothetical protein
VQTLRRIVEHVDCLIGNEEDLQKGLGVKGPEVTKKTESKLDPETFFVMIDEITKQFPNVKCVKFTRVSATLCGHSGASNTSPKARLGANRCTQERAHSRTRSAALKRRRRPVVGSSRAPFRFALVLPPAVGWAALSGSRSPERKRDEFGNGKSVNADH